MTESTYSDQIVDVAGAAELTLPRGWMEGLPQAPRAAGSGRLRKFYAADGFDSQLTYFDPDLPLPEESRTGFLSLIGQMPHAVSDNELQTVSSVLGACSDRDAFRVVAAWTEEVDSRIVLFLEGEWQVSKRFFFGMFADIFGSGWIIEQFYFEAPEPNFSNHLEEVKAALRSLRWRTRS